MKSWQHGYDISFLKSIEAKYKPYNNRAASPFAQFKKNNIAEALHKQQLKTVSYLHGEAMGVVTRSKVRTPVSMYSNGPLVTIKLPGDLTIKHLCGDYVALLTFLNSYHNENVWLHTWAADMEQHQLAQEAGFRYVCSKITSFGEVFSIWFRDNKYNFDKRAILGVPSEDLVNIKKLADVDTKLIDSIREKLEDFGDTFENHYSKYNVKKSWSAFSLRGYSADPHFIAKPIEMSDKWKEEHKDDVFVMQDTPLRKLFPEVDELIAWLDGDIHRIRFMKLTPGGGELERHTDQVDPDAGNGLGKIARLHWPITTTPEVIFTSWNTNDRRVDVNMKVGECWMLDTRMPHKVYNGAPIERIHLVVDVIVTPKLLEKIVS